MRDHGCLTTLSAPSCFGFLALIALLLVGGAVYDLLPADRAAGVSAHR